MITIVDYDAGNLTSVKRALDFLGVPSVITADSDTVCDAERVIFPGVGHARTSIEILKKRGLDAALKDAFGKGTPILGICLGCQIVLSHSDEGNTDLLGFIQGNCPRFALSDPSLKVPHMGWNAITVTKKHFILKNVQPGDEFYFVHSYYPRPSREENVFATCEYDMTFPAAIGYRNLFATQFHPEKSGQLGLTMLKNFCEWDGAPC
ncbi:MAG: imidazole glycerol phosphate synthase subunit HisH [Chitinivibrionales bacterium]|nr:imidazole glycerol phosphate synthase subunit HisH [Chitinivibrionales bacterium]MBD3394493.1 imidazole glycerol phosphate synthase subunit HisH [Chitinivibrionales bacterium]